MVDVLNLGKIELVDYMGSDQSVVQAARISNGAVMPEWRGAPDEKLINFLAAHGHLTPFEHVVFKFYVKCPIFVAREWQRHRTFSYNELSARYKVVEEPDWFYPDQARIPDPNNKQSSTPTDDKRLAEILEMAYWEAYRQANSCYQMMLREGIAKELARSVLPVGIYTEMYVTGNLRNWMHFYELRAAPEAQYEIRRYAEAVGVFLRQVVPLSFEALIQA